MGRLNHWQSGVESFVQRPNREPWRQINPHKLAMLKLAVGHSDDPNSLGAIEEVLAQVNTQLSGMSPSAGLLFAAIDFDHGQILQKIDEAFPGLELIGGTTEGEMSSELGFEQDSLTLIVFCSETVTISAGIGRNVAEDAIIAASSAVQQAQAQHTDTLQFCLTFPESLTICNEIILDSLEHALGEKVPVFGGLTAGKHPSQQTFQFFKTEVCSNSVPILLFSGPIQFSHGVANGWHPIGKAGQVTKATNNVVYEINNQPALSFYHHYLGTLPPTSEYPLALLDAQSNRHYMRAPSGIYDETIGSITFFGSVPKGSVVQITEASHDDILAASSQSVQQALDSYPGKSPDVALFFSCVGRRQLLGSRTKEEHAIAQHHLGKSIPSCGFYTNGEISPLQDNNTSHIHNETFVTLLIGEA